MRATLINFHAHAAPAESGVWAVQNLRQREGLSPENFAVCTVGLHPWFLEKSHEVADFQWLMENAVRPNVLAIGECGLDRAVAVPFDFQEETFLRQVVLAEYLGKPMVLHCVRAHDRLVHLRRRLRPRQPWIFHGFDKHPQAAQMLLDAGCHLSFGRAIFREKSHAAEALRLAPAACFFLETDDKPMRISAIYERAAALRGCSVEVLAAQVCANFEAMFPGFLGGAASLPV